MKFITVLLAAWFMLATTTAAYADPVSLITGLIGAISSIGAVGQLLIAVGLKVGMSLVARAKAKKNQPQESGVKGSLRTGGDNPLSFIVGTYATAGSLEYVGTWGKAGKTPNAYLTQVISLSDIPITGMSNLVWISGKQCTIDWSAEPEALGYPVLEYRVDGRDHLWVLFFDGSQTTASEFLLNSFPDGDRPWLNDMVGRGVAYAVVTARVNREILTSGPSCKFVLQGIKVYDVRKDSTAGGTGPHRWGTPSTYEFSDNPKVVHYNIKRGIYYAGEWVYGGQGISAFQLPASNWMAAMNECDRLVPLADGGTEKQFRCGGEITADFQPIEACKELDKSCNGRTAELGGIYKTICGAPGLPVYSFTDEDIVITDSQTFDQYPGLEETYNGVNATYPEPADAWSTKDAPPRYNAGYEAADAGNRLLADIAYPLVPYGNQVQRLTYAMLEEERRFRKHTGTMSPEAWLLEPLDVISWTSARNGYIAKQFLMGAMDDLASVNQAVAFRELDPNDYDWSSDFQLPTTVGPLGPIEPPPSVIDGWSVEPWTITDAVGAGRRPAIKVHAADDLNDVLSVHIVARVKATGAVVFDSAATPYAAPFAWVLSGNWCLPNTVYQVKGIEVPYSGRDVEWSEWLDVLTPNILLGDGDVYLPGMVEGLQTFVGDATMWIRDGVRQTILDVQRLSRLSLDQDFTAFRDRQTIRQEVASTTGDNKAFFLEQIDVATGPNSALSRRMTIAEATLPGISANARALDLLSARVTNVDGKTDILAQNIVDLSAIVADKVGATAFSALTARVTTEEGKSTSQAASIIDLQTQINGKAAASAFMLLQTQVETVETTVDGKTALYRQTTAPTGTGVKLKDLWAKSNSGNVLYVCTATGATPTWTLSEDQRIPQLVTDVQATADAITAISAGQTTGNLATANFRMGVSAGPAGYSSRIAMEARTGGAGSWRSAGLFIDVPASTGTPTRIVLQADQIAMTNGATVKNPFVFEGSVLYVDELTVRQANIINLMVTTSNIAPGAVSLADSDDLAGGSWSGSNRDLSLTIPHGTGSPKVTIFGVGGASAHPTTAGGGNISVSARAGSTQVGIAFASAQNSAVMGATVIGLHTPASGTASTTYTIRMSGSGVSNAQDMKIVVLVGKR